MISLTSAFIWHPKAMACIFHLLTRHFNTVEFNPEHLTPSQDSQVTRPRPFPFWTTFEEFPSWAYSIWHSIRTIILNLAGAQLQVMFSLWLSWISAVATQMGCSSGLYPQIHGPRAGGTFARGLSSLVLSSFPLAVLYKGIQMEKSQPWDWDSADGNSPSGHRFPWKRITNELC